MFVTFEPGGRVDRSGETSFCPEAMPVPRWAKGTPVERLGLVNGKIIDLRQVKQFFIDPVGALHPARAVESWVPVSCPWDAVMVRDGDRWRVRDDGDEHRARLKRECRRTILAVLSERTQLNLWGQLAVLGTMTSRQMTAAQQREKDAIVAAREWIDATIAECRAAGDQAREAEWPPVPDSVTEIAARF